jgi:hypothetical protein
MLNMSGNIAVFDISLFWYHMHNTCKEQSVKKLLTMFINWLKARLNWTVRLSLTFFTGLIKGLYPLVSNKTLTSLTSSSLPRPENKFIKELLIFCEFFFKPLSVLMTKMTDAMYGIKLISLFKRYRTTVIFVSNDDQLDRNDGYFWSIFFYNNYRQNRYVSIINRAFHLIWLYIKLSHKDYLSGSNTCGLLY